MVGVVKLAQLCSFRELFCVTDVSLRRVLVKVRMLQFFVLWSSVFVQEKSEALATTVDLEWGQTPMNTSSQDLEPGEIGPWELVSDDSSSCASVWSSQVLH